MTRHMNNSKDGLNKKFDTMSQTISIDTETGNMRGSHQGKEEQVQLMSNENLSRQG